MIQLDGLDIDFSDSGEGTPVLFVPGSYATTAAWRPIQKLLVPGYRKVATSLRGYGGSAESRTREDFDIAHEVALVAAVARQVGQPVHLVGHSFGGCVALAAALAGSFPVRSLSVFEANPMALLPELGHEDLLQQTRRMARDFEAAFDAGEADAAGRIIDFWGGEGVFAAMPEVVRAYCRSTAGTNVIDWRTDLAYALTRADCARLDLPVLLVRGGLANQAMVRLTDGLAACLPRARQVAVDGAGHFLISSHPAACADLLNAFLAEVDGPRA